jgi:flagellar biosynthesis GTPase FlhF
MHIHRVRGNSLRDALQRAKRAHGEDAVVVGRETSAGGAVTVAIALRPTPTPAKPRREDRGEREIASRLARSGASPEFSQRVGNAMGQTDPGGDQHVIDRAAEAIGGLFEYASLKRVRGSARALAFVGPPGGGKTTSLSKLALRLVRSGRRVGLATFDTRRVEGLRATAELLGVPFFPLRHERQPAPTELLHSGVEILLVDTSGRPDADIEALNNLWRVLRSERWTTTTQLVLPATRSRAALMELRRSFEGLPLDGCVLTRIDETREPAPALEHVLECKLPLAFLANGPDLTRHFLRAEPGVVADLALRGNLS